MGFWGSLGKGLLKVAPYAAMAIPGVGVPLGMAIQGGLAAADAKASGGSWKNALISGGIGAAGGALGAAKGLGPTKGFLGGLTKAGKQAGTNILGGLANQQAQSIIGRQQQQGQQGGRQAVPVAHGDSKYASPVDSRFEQQMRRGLGPVMGRSNQNFPNLAHALGAGRMDAIKDQPFRKGYTVQTLGNDDMTVINREMPSIGRQKKKKPAAAEETEATA